MNVFDNEHIAAWVDARLEAYVDGELPEDERRRLEQFVDANDEAAFRLELARRVQSMLAATEPPACPPDVARTVLARARAEAAPETPAHTGLTHTKPAHTKPAHTKPAHTKPAHTKPARTYAVPTEAVGAREGDQHTKGQEADARSFRGRDARGVADAMRGPVRRGASAWRGRRAVVGAGILRPTLAAAALVLAVVVSTFIGRAPAEIGSSTPPANVPSNVPAAADATARGSGDVSGEPTPADVERALREAKWALGYVSDVGRRTGRSIRQEVIEERLNAPIERALDSAFLREPNS